MDIIERASEIGTKVAVKAWYLLVPLIYIGAMFYAHYNGFVNPYRNWDMIGYVGSVVQWHEKDPDKLYAETIDTIKAAGIPDWLVKDYFGNPLAANAKAFNEQLPFYQAMPLYNGLIWLVHTVTGVALPVASWSVSSIAFGILAILIWFWRPRYMSREVWLLMVVGLTYLFPWPMNSLACLSTPDAIGAVIQMGAFYAWIWRRNFNVYFALSLLGIVARPDTLIMSSAWELYFITVPKPKDRMPLKPVLILFGLSWVAYFTESHFAHNYGLERWLIYAFIDKTPYPAEATDHLTLQRYWDMFAPSVVAFVSLGRTVTMMLLSVFACFCYYMKPTDGTRMWLHMVILVWLCLVGRFFIFPAWGDDRFYFVYYLPLLYACGEVITPYMRALWFLLQAHRRNVRHIG